MFRKPWEAYCSYCKGINFDTDWIGGGLDLMTGGLYGAVTGDGFDITGKGAAEKQLKANQNAINQNAASQLELDNRMYNDSVARQQPFYDTGVKANAARDRMINGGYDMSASPAAQYQLTQGTKSLNRQLAARGLLGSGNAAQRFADLSSGIAANDYNQQYQRLTDQINAGTGAAQSQNAASNQLGSLGNQAYQNQANATVQNGNNRASLYTNMSPLKIGMDAAGAAGSLMSGMGGL